MISTIEKRVTCVYFHIEKNVYSAVYTINLHQNSCRQFVSRFLPALFCFTHSFAICTSVNLAAKVVQQRLQGKSRAQWQYTRGRVDAIASEPYTGTNKYKYIYIYLFTHTFSLCTRFTHIHTCVSINWLKCTFTLHPRQLHNKAGFLFFPLLNLSPSLLVCCSLR